MTVRISTIPNNPYLGYHAQAFARLASGRLHSPTPTPCSSSCLRHTGIPRVMRLAGQAAREGLQLSSWFWEEERGEAARICDAITEAYD